MCSDGLNLPEVVSDAVEFGGGGSGQQFQLNVNIAGESDREDNDAVGAAVVQNRRIIGGNSRFVDPDRTGVPEGDRRLARERCGNGDPRVFPVQFHADVRAVFIGVVRVVGCRFDVIIMNRRQRVEMREHRLVIEHLHADRGACVDGFVHNARTDEVVALGHDDFRRSRTEFFVVGGDVASVSEDDRQFFCEIEDERHSAAVVLGHRPDAVGTSEFKSRGEKEGLAFEFGGAETVDHKVAEAFRICSGFDGAVPAQEVRGNKRVVVAVDCGGRERHFKHIRLALGGADSGTVNILFARIERLGRHSLPVEELENGETVFLHRAEEGGRGIVGRESAQLGESFGLEPCVELPQPFGDAFFGEGCFGSSEEGVDGVAVILFESAESGIVELVGSDAVVDRHAFCMGDAVEVVRGERRDGELHNDCMIRCDSEIPDSFFRSSGVLINQIMSRVQRSDGIALPGGDYFVSRREVRVFE